MNDLQGRNRRSVRLRGYDYSQAGAYFVTLCAVKRKPVFGRIEQGEMTANIYGNLIAESRQALPVRFSRLALDEFIVMPNHVHVIFLLSASPAGEATETLGQIVAYWKHDSTKRINALRVEKALPPVPVWQRSYHDRIIRDERELNIKRRYIIENPLHWDQDEENPNRLP